MYINRYLDYPDLLRAKTRTNQTFDLHTSIINHNNIIFIIIGVNSLHNCTVPSAKR